MRLWWTSTRGSGGRSSISGRRSKGRRVAPMRHFGTRLPLAALALGLLVSPAAAAEQNLVVQSATEPPGLDLTSKQASESAVVGCYNVTDLQEKSDRHG